MVPVWAYRAATIVDHAGVAVRGLRPTRRFRWPDIQDIRIEHNPVAYTQDAAPRHITVLYDGAGHRVPLPHLNEKNLANLQLTLATEVEAIHSAWQRSRGPQWASAPKVQRKLAERDRYTHTSWMVGAIAGMLTVPVLTVLFVIGLFTHADELPAPLSWLFQPEAIMVLPIVVIPTVTVASRLARRRRAT
jgi:hypothetical protein